MLFPQEKLSAPNYRGVDFEGGAGVLGAEQPWSVENVGRQKEEEDEGGGGGCGDEEQWEPAKEDVHGVSAELGGSFEVRDGMGWWRVSPAKAEHGGMRGITV